MSIYSQLVSPSSEFINGSSILSLNEGVEVYTHCMEAPSNFCEPNLSNSEFNNINGLPGTYDTNPGQWRMRLLDNAAARAVMQQAQSAGTWNLVLGGGPWIFETLINVGTLSTAADEYVIVAGFIDGRANDAISDGVYWEYDRTNSVNWIGVTESGGTRTEIDSSVAVSTGTSAWVKLRFEVNAAGTSIEFFLNGTSVGTSTTNITSNGMQYFIRAMKSASSGAQNILYIDYIYVRNDLTTAL